MAKKLYNLIESGFGRAINYSDEERELYGDVNLNCAERILRGANIAYKLGLSEEALRVSAPFGGGMGIESVCGAITGALMVLGALYTDRAEKNTPLKDEITVPFIKEVRRRQGGLSCTHNKKYAQTNPFDSTPVVLAIAKVLDETIEKIEATSNDPTDITRNVPNADTIAASEEYYDMKDKPEKYKKHDNFDDAMNEVSGAS